MYIFVKNRWKLDFEDHYRFHKLIYVINTIKLAMNLKMPSILKFKTEPNG